MQIKRPSMLDTMHTRNRLPISSQEIDNKQTMIIYSSREKERNYHRSKNKLFNHAHLKGSKEKISFAEQTNNVTINVHMRAKSPSKQHKGGRSPSKGSRKSKNSVFSDQDKLMTRQVAVEYNLNKDLNQRRRDFRSPEEAPSTNKRKQRLSVQIKGLKQIRSRQLQKDQHIRRKQRYPKMFQAAIENPKKTPPRSPRHDFMQQQGEIRVLSNTQAEQLDGLREQNQFYKLIYRASLEKMKRLEKSIGKEKEDYERTKQQFDKQLKSLKYKINRNDKKVLIGHIYSYDQKESLKIQSENIILQTENEASQITKCNEFDDKDRRMANHVPSRLSIDST